MCRGSLNSNQRDQGVPLPNVARVVRPSVFPVTVTTSPGLAADTVVHRFGPQGQLTWLNVTRASGRSQSISRAVTIVFRSTVEGVCGGGNSGFDVALAMRYLATGALEFQNHC